MSTINETIGCVNHDCDKCKSQPASQMLEALLLADAMLSGANMNASVVEKKVRSAIAAATGGTSADDVPETTFGNMAAQPAQQRWAVFCGGCRKEWSAPYQHPGKSICTECEAKYKDAPPAQPAVPEGWKLVPARLTQNMAEAAKAVDGRLSVWKYDEAYQAMLAAAPEKGGV